MQRISFHENITQEVQILLLEQLKEYETNTSMSKEEHKELHDWVAKGRSPYFFFKEVGVLVMPAI